VHYISACSVTLDILLRTATNNAVYFLKLVRKSSVVLVDVNVYQHKINTEGI